MILKLISIKNVGRFLNCNATGDIALRKNNLVFAENGRGKTTLSAILRSLKSGNASLVLGRATLGAVDPPEIEILLDNGRTAIFRHGAWNTTLENLAVFDENFVTENVYSGQAVELDHRRKLYGVIVGQQGTDLARRIEELDSASREKSVTIRDKRAAVQAIALGLTTEAFVALEADPAIAETINAQEKLLAAVRATEQIRHRTALSPLAVPALPLGITDLLAKTLEGLAADAEQRVTAQIKVHTMPRRGEAWLSEGLGYVRDDACPFCGQRLGGVDLIAAYRTYFGEAYNEHRRQIATQRAQVDAALGDRKLAGVERTIDQNTAAVEFWSHYLEITAPVMHPEAVDALRSLREATLALLDLKSASPIEPVVPDIAFTTAQALVERVEAAAAEYNALVTAANLLIETKRAETGAADIQAVRATLSRLQATKARHDPPGVEACSDLAGAIAEKNAIETEKAAVRTRLDEYSQEVMRQYERTINRLLGEFQAGFRLTDTTPSYVGGIASSSYKILINETPVELGDAGTAPQLPSFRNTLSSGDKSTLALAFFLAQLKHDPNSATKTVVFDDPFNSQDAFRKDHTIRRIQQCGTDCAQVVVLSHDQDFLKRIWDRLDPAHRKCLKLARVGLYDTTILELDIEEATQAAYKTMLRVLLDYCQDGKGDPRNVVQTIRPVLESYCKFLGGDLFADNDTLGVMVGKVRDTGPGHQLFQLADDLDNLNVFTRRYHHGDNPHAATEQINDIELQGFVRTALTIVGFC